MFVLTCVYGNEFVSRSEEVSVLRQYYVGSVCVCITEELQVCDKRQKIRLEQQGYESSLFLSSPLQLANVHIYSAH